MIYSCLFQLAVEVVSQFLPSRTFVLGGASSYSLSPSRCVDGRLVSNPGDCSPLGGGGGFPFFPLLLILGAASVVYLRAKKKGVSKKSYVLGKLSQAAKVFGRVQDKEYVQKKAGQAREIFDQARDALSANEGNSDLVKQAVDKYKADNPEQASSVSYTNSTISGKFILIKDLDGRLLSEIPLESH